MDDDDLGSACDISSLYITDDASIHVHSLSGARQSVRVKSNHGHVNVDASSPKPEVINEMTGEIVPIVDLGGVNGACEVFVRGPTANGGKDHSWVSCHIHVDSISTESMSLLQSNAGNVHVTFDRKVETDLRLFSSQNAASVDVDTLLGDEEDSTDFEKLKHMLRALDESTASQREKAIMIRTKAFTSKKKTYDLRLRNCAFVDGWIQNKSAEPDSRFDRKLRGDSGSVGKIRIEGAAHQALKGFQGGLEEQNSFPRPIFAIASTGEIVIETLSWMGNIARRYGLDDHRNNENLGRTATRRGRSFEPLRE